MSAVASLPSPADLLELRHMRMALAEIALLAVAGGLLGTWVVLRRLAFFAHSAGTATFPGLVVADGTGFSATLAALGVALGYAGGVERAGRSGRDFGDTATALALVLALALGVVLASDVFESGSSVDRLLFGSALALDSGDLRLAGGGALVALVATLTLGRAWAASGFEPGGARALGLPARRADLLLLMLVGATVVAALPAVGALLVASVFVVPATSARLLTERIGPMLRASVALAGAQGLIGVYVSLWLDVPPGPAIAVVGAAMFASLAAMRAAWAHRSRAPSRLSEAPA